MYSIRRENRAHERSSKQHTQNSKRKGGREERCKEHAIEMMIGIEIVIVKGGTSIYTHGIKRKDKRKGEWRG